MNIVKFPSFGLELNVPKIAIKLFGIDIYFYAICIVIGIIVALLFAKYTKEKYEIEHEILIEYIIGAIIFGYIGARLYYVIFNLNKYINNPIKIFNIRDGGLAIYGGIILGGLFIYIKCKKNKVNFLDFCDYIIPFLAIAQSIGRWGNFFNKEAYGTETNNIFRMGIFDISGKYIEVHPTFLYESICTFIIFLLLKKMQKKRKFKGQILYFYMIFYSFIRIFIETLRIDSLMIGDFKISQILSIIFFVFFSYKLFENRKKYC